MSCDNSDFEWIGPPVPCIYQTLNTGKYTFYESFKKAGHVYKIGDFVKVNSSHGRVDEICKLRCLYESKEARHQSQPFKGFVQPYMFANELRNTLRKMGIEFSEGTELIEDYESVKIVINLEFVKSECKVEFYPVSHSCYMNKKVDKSCNYFCRFKYEHKQILPVLSNESKNNADSDEDDELISSTDEDLDDDIVMSEIQNTQIVITDEDIRNTDKTPSSKKGTKSPKLQNKESSSEESCEESRQLNSRRNSVRKNLTHSFQSDRDYSSELNYSIIENTPEEKQLKVKLRLSRRQTRSPRKHNCSNVCINESVLIISSPTLEKLNESIKDKSSTPLVVIEKTNNNELLCTEEPSGKSDEGDSNRRRTRNARVATPVSVSARRSNRVIQRVSYADYLSPVECSPPKRSRLRSDDSELNKVLYPNLGKENINDTNLPVATDVSEEVGKNETPKKRTRCRTKYYYYTSESEFEDDDKSETVVVGKRSVKPPKYLQDICESPVKALKLQTPKTTKNSESAQNAEPKIKSLKSTPKAKLKSKLFEHTPRSTPKKTPGSRIKLLRSGTITPSLQGRDKALVSCDSPLMRARSQLHVSYVPNALPCREKEYQNIYVFLKDKLLDGCGGCMYVSGVPGTGKTATVTSVINNLLEDAKAEMVPEFRFVNINGMKLTEPRQAYVEIMRQLSNRTLPWEQAQSMLEDKFTKTQKKDRVPIIMLVDELDILCTKRQDVVYNLLDWPTKAKTQLIVITIANTMDLPERLLMNRVTSRLGLTRLTFQAYTHKQLQEIVTKRLMGTDSFNPDAIQLVARKVASVSGDARRALDICRRAAEIAELEGPDTYVSLQHVNEALNAMITQPKVQAIKRCSRLEQLLLQSVVAEIERTGVEETIFSDVFKMLTSVSTLEGFKTVSSKLVLAAVSRLSACRLLIADSKCSNINQRIILNVSNDDVYYALRRD